MLKKGDKIVILLGVFLIILSFVAVFWLSSPGKRVVISKDNEIVFEGSLNKNAEIKLEGNTVKIEDGFVFVESATCKNQICVKHKKISKEKESIVCLPNSLLVEIK